MFAVLANTNAGVSLELDEGTRLGGGYPPIHVLPGAMAFAEDNHISGKQFSEALSAGYEILSCIAGSMILRPNLHSHGTWGTIETSIALGKMLGFDLDQTKALINLAASMSPPNTWTPSFDGATIRNGYPCRSGMQGILAVDRLQCGFSSLRGGPLDVYGTILAQSFDPDMSVDELGSGPMRIEQNYFKYYPCCLFNHPTFNAVEQLMGRWQFAVQDIEAIKVTTVNFGSERMAGEHP
jgi:2-methylcitrate dehydratase PrpD